MKRLLLVVFVLGVLSALSAMALAKEPTVRVKGMLGPQTITFSTRDVRSPLDETFNSTDVPVDIPDGPGGEVESDLVINASYDIADLNVFVSITHTYDSDLQIFISKEGGPEVRLFNHRGGSGDNITDCHFDDEATQTIGSGTAPFTGSYRPEAPLAAFDALSVTGTWHLRVLDDAAQDVGTIDAWGMDVTAASANNGEVQGVVTEAGSGDLLGRADIALSGQSSHDCSAEDGTYRFTQVPSGTYTVTIDEEFHYPHIQNNVVVPAGGFVIVDAALTPWPDLETATAPSTGAAVPINDLDSSFKSIVVANTFAISDIDVIVNITHSYIGDLDVWVESPSGARAQLMLHNVANNGADITDCRFDDEACRSISDATSPYTGRWAPVAGLCADAESGNANGQWRLIAYDNYAQDTGSIDNWTLIVSHYTVLDADPARPDLPGSFRFDGNFPNPFNNSTEFRFALNRSQHVELTLYNSTGQQVTTVLDQDMNAGEHSAYFDASGLTTGLYFARMTAGNQTQTHKLVLLK